MQRSTQFNWRKTAEKTLEVYYDVPPATRSPSRASGARIGFGSMKLFPISLAAFLASAQAFGQAPKPHRRPARHRPHGRRSPPRRRPALRRRGPALFGERAQRPFPGRGAIPIQARGGRWRFALSLDAAIPGFIVSDSYQSTAAGSSVRLNW